MSSDDLTRYRDNLAAASSLALLGASGLEGFQKSDDSSVSNHRKFGDHSDREDPKELALTQSNESGDLTSADDIKSSFQRELISKLDENSNASLPDGDIESKDQQLAFEEYLRSQPDLHHGYSVHKFKCHRCKVGFPRMSFLSAHNKTLTHRQGSKLSHPLEKYYDPNRPFKCEVCMESFTQKNILVVHYNSVSHLHRLKQQNQPSQSKEVSAESTSCNEGLHPENLSNGLTSNISTKVVMDELDIKASKALGVGSMGTNISSLSPMTGNLSSTADKSSISMEKTTSQASVYHVEEVNKQPGKYQCFICHVSYNQNALLDEHINSALHQKNSIKLSLPSSSGVPSSATFNKVLMNSPRLPEQLKYMPDIFNQAMLSPFLAQTSVMLSSGSMCPFPMNGPIYTSSRPYNAASHSSAQRYEEISKSLMSNVSVATNGSRSQISPRANVDYPKMPSVSLVLAAPQPMSQIVTPHVCQQCGGIFTSAEFLAQHTFTNCTGSHSGSQTSHLVRQPLIQSSSAGFRKSNVYLALLENFGFECAMQFNENRQKLKKAEVAKEKVESEQIDSENINPNSADVEKSQVSVANLGDKVVLPEIKENAIDIPELQKSICRHCSKEFSSIWVLKNHEEEIHKDLLPLDRVIKFGKQFMKMLKRKRKSFEHSAGVSAKTNQESSSIKVMKTPDLHPLPPPSGPEATLAYPQGPTADMYSAQAAQMLQLQFLMGMNMNMLPPFMPMMMPLGAELLGMPPFPTIDPMTMLLQQHQQKQQQQQQQQKHQQKQQQSQQATVPQQPQQASTSKSGRTRISDDQLNVLRTHFDINNSPGEDQIHEMAERTGLIPKVIKHWFRNTLFKERQRNKDSPYNFSVPPSTTLNLEDYEKMRPVPIKTEPIQTTSDNRMNGAAGAALSVSIPFSNNYDPAARSVTTSTPKLDQYSKDFTKQDDYAKRSTNLPFTSLDASSSMTNFPFPASLFGPNFGFGLQDMSAAMISSLMQMTPQYNVLTAVRPPAPSTPKANGLPPQTPALNVSGASCSSQERRANRTRFTNHQMNVLQDFFEKNAYPKDDELESMSKLLDLSSRVIVVWFQNARQKIRKVYENQPSVPPTTCVEDAPGTRTGVFQSEGPIYQCKKCCLSFSQYYELIKHKRAVCYKDEDGRVSEEISYYEENEDGSESGDDSESEIRSVEDTVGIEYRCEKCNLTFDRLEDWKEHQAIHAARLGLSLPKLQSSVVDIHQSVEEPQSTSSACLSGSLDSGTLITKETSDGDGDSKDDQPKDKRMRTTILPEQLDYLYHVYQSDCNPSRKQLDAIAFKVGLKKRVVQVWFQNTRARERKGQFRAHQQLINKRCPYCKALFRAKSALEAHLAMKHPEEMSKCDLNVDSIPDEPADSAQHQERSPAEHSSSNHTVTRQMMPSSSVFAIQNSFMPMLPSSGPPLQNSTALAMQNSFLPDLGIPGLMPCTSADTTDVLHANMQRLYEDSFKKYIYQLSLGSHPQLPLETPRLRPEATSTPNKIKHEDVPLDLSMPVPQVRIEKTKPPPALIVLEKEMSHSRRQLSMDDSQPEFHSNNNDTLNMAGGCHNNDRNCATNQIESGNNNDDGIDDMSQNGDYNNVDNHDTMSQAGCNNINGNHNNNNDEMSRLCGSDSPTSSSSNQFRSQNWQANKRYRTQMSSTQIKVMKVIFLEYKTPTMSECQALGREIGLAKRVVQVWFQNARAKEKKSSSTYSDLLGNVSAGVTSQPLSAADQCKLCGVHYSHQSTLQDGILQDHLFTKAHIDRVKAFVGNQVDDTECTSANGDSDNAGRQYKQPVGVNERKHKGSSSSSNQMMTNSAQHGSSTPFVNQSNGNSYVSSWPYIYLLCSAYIFIIIIVVLTSVFLCKIRSDR